MREQHRPDEIARLRAEFAARLAAQDATIARLQRRRRFPRRLLPLLLAAFLVALVPLATLAAGAFTDLNQGAEHAAANADIQAIADAGITKGCNPPDYTNYCPNDYVLREQMASFLARGLGLGGNAPVANAKTAQTATNATNAINAGNATTVGGYAAGDLIHATRAIGPATDITLTATFQTVATIAITTQKGGLVVVNGAAQFVERIKYQEGIEVRLRDITTSGGNASPILRVATVYDTGATAIYGASPIADATASPTFLFDSGTLGTRTYVLEARLTAGTTPDTVIAAPAGRTVPTALFTPFDATGAPTP